MSKPSEISILIQETTVQTMKDMRMNYREFAEYLAESMSKEGGIKLSHASIYNWANNGTLPTTDFLEDLVSVYPVSDRRFVFALRLLAIKSPHVWGPDGVVWTLERSIAKIISRAV